MALEETTHTRQRRQRIRDPVTSLKVTPTSRTRTSKSPPKPVSLTTQKELTFQFVRKDTSFELNFTALGSFPPSSCNTSVFTPGFKSTLNCEPTLTGTPFNQVVGMPPARLNFAGPPFAD